MPSIEYAEHKLGVGVRARFEIAPPAPANPVRPPVARRLATRSDVARASGEASIV